MARTPNRPQPDSPLSDVLAQMNQNFDTIDDQDETKIIKNGSTPTLLLGRQVQGFGGLDYGLKIAKPGYDVTTATDDQLIFNSAQNVFKIRLSGTDSITVPTSVSTDPYSTYITIPHGLDYVPAVLGYVKTFRDDAVLGYFWSAVPYTVGSGTFEVLSDETNVYLVLSVLQQIAWSDVTVPYRYYVLQETAT